MDLPIPPSKRNSKPGTRVRIAERRVKALELRKQGFSYRRIAAQLGCSDFTVIRDIKFVLENLIKHSAEKAEELRELQNQRLEMIIETLWKPAQAGGLWHIDRFLNAVQQFSVLNGCNRPVPKILAGDPDKPIDINHHHEIESRLLARMRVLAGLDSPPSDEVIDVTPDALPTPPINLSES